MLAKREQVLLSFQRLQQNHDEIAHRDILSFSLYKRLKHMVLHFYKYAGNIERAKAERDRLVLQRILVDVFIICMASANSLNLSLASKIGKDEENIDDLAKGFGLEFSDKDPFEEAVKVLLIIGGQMAKVMESSDHLEIGNPRSQMEELIPELTMKTLGLLGSLSTNLDVLIRSRLSSVEAKSIFRK